MQASQVVSVSNADFTSKYVHVPFVELSQTEHTHVTSTQIKKQNIISPQKTPLCSPQAATLL